MKRDKTAIFESDTKQQILKLRQICGGCERKKNCPLILIKIAVCINGKSKFSKSKQLFQMHSVMKASKMHLLGIQSGCILLNNDLPVRRRKQQENVFYHDVV